MNALGLRATLDLARRAHGIMHDTSMANSFARSYRSVMVGRIAWIVRAMTQHKVYRNCTENGYIPTSLECEQNRLRVHVRASGFKC